MSETDVAADAPPALPGDGLREGIIDALRRDIGDGLVDTHLVPNDDLWIRVATDSWRAAAEALRAAGFDYFCFLSALDWMPSPYGRGEDDPTQPPPERSTEIKQGYAGGETRFQVLARLTDTTRHVGVTLKADVADDALAVDTWVAVYAGANWHERETHEMFGIGFNGHPDLRNMYLPTEFEGYPLRKDFPLLARMVKPWPGIVDVEPLPLSDTDGEAADAAAVGTGDSPLNDAVDADVAPADAVDAVSDAGGEAADAAAVGTGDSPLNDAVDADVAPADAVDAVSDAGGEAADAAAVGTGDSPLNDAVDADVAPADAVDAVSDAGGEAADAAAVGTGDSPLNDAVDADVAPADAVDAVSDAGGEAADAAAVGTGDSPLNDAVDADVAPADAVDAVSDAGGEAADAAAVGTGDSPLNDAVDADVAPADAVDPDVASPDAADPAATPSDAADEPIAEGESS